MNNFKINIQYDGTNYYGWQIQPDKITVQGVLKKNIELILQESIILTGASRTDKGVHARGQVASFFSKSSLPPKQIEKKLNQLIPDDIRITSVKIIDKDFNARKSVKKKKYRYFIYHNSINSPFYKNYSWHVEKKIDINILNKASEQLIGIKNFYSFTGAKACNKTYTREINEAFWIKKNNFYIFTIVGNGFLKNMIRKIVGSLIAINCNIEKSDFISYLINVRDRKKGKYMAPPEGLFLEEIFY